MNPVCLGIRALALAVISSLFSVVRGASPEEIEKQLLTVLGMKRRPRGARRDIPEYMIRMYEAQSGLPFDTTNFPSPGKMTGSANTLRSLDCLREGPGVVNNIKTRTYLKFDLNHWSEGERLTAAELRVNIASDRKRTSDSTISSSSSISSSGSSNSWRGRQDAGSRPRREVYSISVLEVLSVKRGRQPSMRLLDTRTLDLNEAASEGWYNLDVLPAVERWREQMGVGIAGSVGGLVLEIKPETTANTTTQAGIDLSQQKVTWTISHPNILLYIDDGRGDDSSDGHRSRRSAKNKRRNRRRKGGRRVENICRRHKLYVDFQDVGWNDWIVAPPGYHAYFCLGDCPFPMADHLNSTNHAIVQTLVNSVNPSAVPRACCVPTDLSPISMLYLDEYDKVVLKNYKDMVVEGCGCR